jgi:imidazolonepropionase-like amidohydrolase
LIDAHCHLCLGADDALWSRHGHDPVGIVAWGLAASAAAVKAGITTVADVGSPHGLALRLPQIIEDGLIIGPTVLSAGPAITTTAGHGADEIGIAADTANEVVRAVRRNVAGGAHLIKIMTSGGATDPSSNRRRAQYTTNELAAGIADAHRLGRRVVGHANATEAITRSVEAGIDMVAHCNWLGERPGTVEVNPETVERMAANNVWIDLNIQGALRSLADTDGEVINWPYPDPRPTSRWELLQPLRRSGVGLYLSSDAYGPGIGSFPRFLSELRSRWNVKAEELISLVTGEPARALGIDSERGILTAGAIADFVVLPGDVRTNPAFITEPVAVFRDGTEIVKEGWLAAPELSQAPQLQTQAQQDLLDLVFQELN